MGRHVAPNATLMTDEAHMYKMFAEDSGRKHETVMHSRKEYVRQGNSTIHSNTVEGINGTFHHVSRAHLARYCDEFAFRYERRKASDSDRTKSLVLNAEGKRLTYQQPA